MSSSPTPKPEIAFIGLGAMGFGMATNLVKQGYKVTGLDVWAPTLERFRAAGGQTATSPAEAVAGKPFCVCMVATAQQAQSVLIDGAEAAVRAMPQGAALLLCSTVPSSYAQELERCIAEVAGRPDVLVVDCPVSGGSYRAADGTLSIMAGASSPAALDKARFLLQEMSDPAKLYIVSKPGGTGAGSNMKMVHQVLAAVQILSGSEAMGFASHLGLDLAKTAEAIKKSAGRSWMFENRSQRILHPEFQPIASALTIILKDTSIITSEARRIGFPTPMVSTAEQVYFSGLAKGYGPDDDSSLIRLYTEGKGKVGPVAGIASTEEEKLSLVVSLLKGIHLCSAGEMVTLAVRLGMDLNQVFELCVNAAGGSYMLETAGLDMVRLFDAKIEGSAAAIENRESLLALAKELEDAVNEAQRLKVPVYLGSQALNLVRLALAHQPSTAPEPKAQEVVRVWGS